jgi:enoyl-CoA hydratase
MCGRGRGAFLPLTTPVILASETEQGVAVLTMHHGKANTIDLEFAEALRLRLDEALSADHPAAVLTGEGSIFSAGVDLIQLRDGGPDYARTIVIAMVEVFAAMVRFPRPLVAAINGAAIAGGCVIACACDYRLISSPTGRIGLTELLVGVPLPAVALEIVRCALGLTGSRRLLYLGSVLGPAAAVDAGLADEIVAEPLLMDRAVAVAGGLGRLPRRTFETTKEQLNRPILDAVDRMAGVWETRIMDVWSSDEIHRSVGRYVDERL